jgi:hypothetical protein
MILRVKTSTDKKAKNAVTLLGEEGSEKTGLANDRRLRVWLVLSKRSRSRFSRLSWRDRQIPKGLGSRDFAPATLHLA